MFKMRILIAAIMLLICSIEDIRTHKVNIILPVTVGLFSLLMCDSLIMCFISLIPGLTLIITAKFIKGIGEGDGYVILSLGMIAGIDDTLTTLFLSFLFASFYAGCLAIVKKSLKNKEFAFVPFILAGYLICVLEKIFIKTVL